VIEGARGGNQCRGVNIVAASAPTFNDCTVRAYQRDGYKWSYDSSNNGRFRPYPNIPYVVIELSIYVSSTQSATLDIGTSAGGSDIASGIDLSTAGYQSVSFTPQQQSADGYLYATPSSSIPNGSVDINYTVASANQNGAGVWLESGAPVEFRNCTFIGSANSTGGGAYIRNDASTSLAFIFSECTFSSLRPSSKWAVGADTSVSNVPVYESVLDGGTFNVSTASGTSEGSNTIV
jgi:hypothetical protein